MQGSSGSRLLTADENKILLSLLGNHCLAQKSAVVRLYLPQDTVHWQRICTGVVCYIKDYTMKSFYFRIYDIVNHRMIWEQEIFKEFEYSSQMDCLHTFTADSSVAGFSFASDIEARDFSEAIIQKLRSRTPHKSSSRTSGSVQHKPSPPSQPAAVSTPATAPTSNSSSGSSLVSSLKINSLLNRKPKKKKITKVDIGMPTDFRQIDHIGIEGPSAVSDGPLFSSQEAQTMKEMLKLLNMEHLLDRQEDAQFVYDLIQHNGGMEQAEEVIRAKPLPPPKPTSIETAGPPLSGNIPPPPPPPPPPPGISAGISAGPPRLPPTADKPKIVVEEDSRGSLLSQISNFKKNELKSAENTAGRPAPKAAPAASSNLLNLLSDALVERYPMMHPPSDSDEEQVDEDSDAWDE